MDNTSSTIRSSRSSRCPDRFRFAGRFSYLCGKKLRKECNLLEMSVG